MRHSALQLLYVKRWLSKRYQRAPTNRRERPLPSPNMGMIMNAFGKALLAVLNSAIVIGFGPGLAAIVALGVLVIK